MSLLLHYSKPRTEAGPLTIKSKGIVSLYTSRRNWDSGPNDVDMDLPLSDFVKAIESYLMSEEHPGEVAFGPVIRIPAVDFEQASFYVMTNTDLSVDDPRLGLLEKVKGMGIGDERVNLLDMLKALHEVEGWEVGAKRLSI